MGKNERLIDSKQSKYYCRRGWLAKQLKLAKTMLINDYNILNDKNYIGFSPDPFNLFILI